MIDIIEKNPQILYRDKRNGMGLSMGLLSFGYRQFATTTRFQQLQIIKQISADISNQPDVNLIADLAFNSLLDSIKITICFENLFKVLLVSNGYVIHKLDSKIFPDLYKEQFKRPVKFDEVKALGEWEVKTHIDLPEQWMKEQIKGIGNLTLGMKELLSPKYIEYYNLDKEILRICNPYFLYRNNLHLYAGEIFTIYESAYKDFTKMIDFINADLIRIHNQIVDVLKKGDQYKLPTLTYS